jgi:hypothetical protein
MSKKSTSLEFEDLESLQVTVDTGNLLPKVIALESTKTPQLTLDDHAKFFIEPLTEGQHLDHISVLREDGYGDGAIVLALLKAVLDSEVWRSARYFFEEADLVAKSNFSFTKTRNCKQCNASFTPPRAGQLYCCNACGWRAQGMAPHVEHEDGCPVFQQAA